MKLVAPGSPLHRLGERLEQFSDGPLARRLLVFTFYWVVASASFAGFFSKWGLQDVNPTFSAVATIDRTAKRPFVYRQLVPGIADLLDAVVPETGKAAFHDLVSPEQQFVRAQDVTRPEYTFRYLVVYACTFLALLLTLPLLQVVLHDAGVRGHARYLAPAAFLLAFPYVQTVGGYFYDATELLFLALAFRMATRGNAIGLVAVAAVATLNKESFLVCLPALYPILRSVRTRNATVAILGASAAVSAAVNVLLKYLLRNTPGAVVERHLRDNIIHYLTPSTYFEAEMTYGIPGPKGMFIGTMLVMLIVIARGWRYCSEPVRRYLQISVVVNVPLFVAFCATGELRNLSLCSVGFVMLLAYAIEQRNATAE